MLCVVRLVRIAGAEGWLLAATGRGAINLKSGAPRPCDRKLIGSLA